MLVAWKGADLVRDIGVQPNNFCKKKKTKLAYMHRQFDQIRIQLAK